MRRSAGEKMINEKVAEFRQQKKNKGALQAAGVHFFFLPSL